jgi:hypothetical protein
MVGVKSKCSETAQSWGDVNRRYTTLTAATPLNTTQHDFKRRYTTPNDVKRRYVPCFQSFEGIKKLFLEVATGVGSEDRGFEYRQGIRS